jgi:hypothetical protein
VKKIPPRYFFAILVVLVVGGCWTDEGGPPPPMVLNSDPDYESYAPDPNIVPVVGDLGDLASVDIWVGSGSFDSDDDPSSLDGWLGILDSGYESSGDVVPVGDLGDPNNWSLDYIGKAEIVPSYDYFTLHFYDEENDYYGSDEYRRNRTTNVVEVNYDDDDDNVWSSTLEKTYGLAYFSDDSWSYKKPPSWIVMIPSGGIGFREYKIGPNDSATLNEVPSPAPGTVENFSYNPWSGLWESFHAVKDYFTTPNDSSSLGWRSFQEQHYDTQKDSKTQELPQDTKIFPGNRNPIGPGSNPFATTGRKQELLEDTKTPGLNLATPSVGSTRAVGGGFFERKRELLEEAKGVSGIGNSPTSTESKLTTSGRRQELLDEAKVTPSSGKATGIGSDRKQGLLENSKGNSFNTKNSLEEKSFKNSIGEKSSRSTFTNDKIFSQQESKSFAPLGGKTFSGTGTRAPTSGKSFKMHGF